MENGESNCYILTYIHTYIHKFKKECKSQESPIFLCKGKGLGSVTNYLLKIAVTALDS